MPRLYAEKAAALQVDSMSPGIVDPGDVLRYTIRIHNNSQLPVTQAVLRDVGAREHDLRRRLDDAERPARRPARRRRVAAHRGRRRELVEPDAAVARPRRRDAVGRPDGRRAVRSARERRRAARHGDHEPGDRRDARRCRDVLTDGDGNPATGPEPTVVVVGDPQRLRITKDVAVVGGGPAHRGRDARVRRATPRTSAPCRRTHVVIRDDIAVPQPGLSHVRQRVVHDERLDGRDHGRGLAADRRLLDDLRRAAAGALDHAAVPRRAEREPRDRHASHEHGHGLLERPDADRERERLASTSAASPGVGILNGRAWHDANFNDVVDATERVLEGWTVELYRNDTLAYSATTDATGVYRISGVTANYQTHGQVRAAIHRARRRRPNGEARPRATRRSRNDLQRIYDIVVQPGSNLQNLNLPIEPNGVVYNSMSRAPIPGATVTMVQAGSRTALPASCFDDPAQQGQVDARATATTSST